MKVDTMGWVEKVGSWYLIPSSLLAALTKELEGSQKAVDRGFLEGPSTTATAHFGGQRGRKTCSETGPLWIWRPIVSLDNHICCWQDFLALPWEPFFGRNIERYIVDRHSLSSIWREKWEAERKSNVHNGLQQMMVVGGGWIKSKAGA